MSIKQQALSLSRASAGPVSAESAGVVAFIVCFAVIAYGSFLDERASVWWTDLAWTFAALLTGLKCMRVSAGLEQHERLAWRLFGGACFAWFAGMLIWDYHELLRGALTPFPAMSDIGFLAFAPFFMAAFVALQSRVPRYAFTVVQIAKLGILVCGIVIAHLIVLLEPIRQLNGNWLYVSTALAYPALYMSALVYGIGSVWRLLERGLPKGVPLVLLGFAFHALADTVYAYGLLGNTYQVGDHIDVLWLIGFGLIYGGALRRQYGAGARAVDAASSEVGGNLPTGWRGYDAMVPVIAVLCVLLVSYVYQAQLTPATIQMLFPFAFMMVVFIAIGEFATQRFQSDIQWKLAQSEAHLRAVLSTIPYGVQEIDIQGNILFSNAAHDTLFGYAPGELRGRNISMLLADPKEGQAIGSYLAYLAEQQPPPEPYFSADRKQDGSVIQIQVDWNYNFDANGRVVGFISIISDITAKRLIEDQLRQAAAVFQSTSEAVMVTDAEARVSAVNAAFTAITGYAQEEVLGKTPKVLRSGRHDDEFHDDMWRTIKEEGRWRGEIWNRRKNGEVFPVWQAVSTIKDDEGKVSHYVSVFSDISSIKQTQEQLNYLAYHDPLTDLPNRLLFNDRLTHAMERAARAQCQLAVLFIDLDNFKNVNDSLGHPVGDELLIKVASRLRNLSRKDDTVARLSGDEFVIVLENIHDAQDTVVLAQKLIEAFQEPFLVRGHELHVTLSIGVSVYPRDGSNVQTLVRNADAALYRAKEEGRNDFYYYTEELTASVFERLKLESALRNALKNDELVLHYQPLISLHSGRPIGVEALLRWQHPEFGLLPPNRFIGLAEDTGLIVPLGEWVLSSACRQMKAWLQQGCDIERVAVNVSGLQLRRGDFQTTVNDILLATGLEPEHLELEITENFIMHKTERAIDILDNLKALGIQIAIDDFGTGYSSLSHLKRLPVDKLKIDRSFVRDIPEDANDEAIARAVVALGRTLQLKVIAEGVETPEQQRFLISQQCDEAQGFLYSKPVPAAQVADLLKCLPALIASHSS